MTARRRTDVDLGRAAVVEALGVIDAGGEPGRTVLATAARYLLEELAARAPGRSVEVRVPPHGVAQCVQGPRHVRGTPPNVVETDAVTWLELATGRLAWAAALTTGRVTASGGRADLAGYLPVWSPGD